MINYPNHKIYVGAAVAYNISSYPENDFYKRYGNSTSILKKSPFLDFEKGWINIQARAGYLIDKKIEIATSARVAGAFANYSAFALKPSLYMLGVNYHF